MKAVLLIFMLLMSGCAAINTQRVNNAMKLWEGQSINELVLAIGYPDRTFKAPNGRTVYAYERSNIGTTPTFTTPSQTHTTYLPYGNSSISQTYGGNTYGGQVVTYYCNLYFEVDHGQKISSWRWEGNSCN